jgi:hypothetical protein
VDAIDELTSSSTIAKYFAQSRNSWWPDGVLAAPLPPRGASQRIDTKIAAKTLLIRFFTDYLKRLVGTNRCRKGAIYVFDALQHGKLNRRLFLVILEVFIIALFDEYNMEGIFAHLYTMIDKKYGSKTMHRKSPS